MNFDVCVIGSGPGGYVCAIRAAQKGLKVVVIEKSSVGGVCLNVGCIPSKTLITAAHYYHKAQHDFPEMGLEVKSLKLNMKKLNKWKNVVTSRMSQGVKALLKANKVQVIQGVATFISPHEIKVEKEESITVKARYFVIATGSSSASIPFLPCDEKNILSSTGALDLEKLPDSLAVIGGGYIGLELGTYFAKMGSKVHILEASESLLSGMCDKDITQVLEKKLKTLGAKIHYGALAQNFKMKDDKINLSYIKKSQTEVLSVNKVLMTIGRTPNTKSLGLKKAGVQLDEKKFVKVDAQRRTNVHHIFAIGDVSTQPMLAHKASFEGVMVADVMGGANRAYDVKCVPAVIFTDPEVASVGLNETECKQQNMKIVIGKFPFAANGRAVSMRETEGFIKIIARKSDHIVVGVHMVGPEVSQLISEATLALEMGTRLEDFATTIHPHPTLGETLMEAAEVALGHPIHVLPSR